MFNPKLISLLIIAVFLQSCVPGGLLMRVAGGAAVRSAGTAAVRTAAPRVVLSETFVAAAGSRGALHRVLTSATANGTRSASLGFSRTGRMFVNGVPVAQLEFGSGRILYGNHVIGQLRGSQLIGFSDAGEQIILGPVRGLVSGRLLPGRAGSFGQRNVGIKGSFVAARVEIRPGKFLLTFESGVQMELPPGFVALAVLAAADQSDDCPAGPGAAIRKLGEVIAFEHCEDLGEVRLLHTSSGLVAIDRLDIAATITGRLSADEGSVEVADGISLWGNVERDGETVRILGDDGPILVADAASIAPAPVRTGYVPGG